MIYVGSHNHATALFKHGDSCFYYDPNNHQGEAMTQSVDELAQLIFDANFISSFEQHADPTKASPLSFRIFSLDVGVSPVYPPQQSLLSSIKPALSCERGYAYGMTGLHIAVRCGCLESVRYLLRQGVNPGTVDEQGCSALLYAADHGGFELIREFKPLLKVGDINLVNKSGSSALMVAASSGCIETIIELLEFPGIDLNLMSKNGRMNALMLAAEGGYTEIVRALLRFGAAINLVNKFGHTALMLAVIHGYFDVIHELCQHRDIDPNLADLNKATPLMSASGKGRIGIVRELLGCVGINVNLVDRSGRAALMYAAEHGELEVIRELLKCSDIDVNLVGQDQWSALMWAASRNHFAVVKELLLFPKIDFKDAVNILASEQPLTREIQILLIVASSVTARDLFENDRRALLHLEIDTKIIDEFARALQIRDVQQIESCVQVMGIELASSEIEKIIFNASLREQSVAMTP